MESDVDSQTGGSEISSSKQSTYSDNENHSETIYAAHIIDAIDPYLCILCLCSMAHPRINNLCKHCRTQMSKDPSFRYLHETTLQVYKFFICLQ